MSKTELVFDLSSLKEAGINLSLSKGDIIDLMIENVREKLLARLDELHTEQYERYHSYQEALIEFYSAEEKRILKTSASVKKLITALRGVAEVKNPQIHFETRFWRDNDVFNSCLDVYLVPEGIQREAYERFEFEHHCRTGPAFRYDPDFEGREKLYFPNLQYNCVASGYKSIKTGVRLMKFTTEAPAKVVDMQQRAQREEDEMRNEVRTIGEQLYKLDRSNRALKVQVLRAIAASTPQGSKLLAAIDARSGKEAAKALLTE